MSADEPEADVIKYNPELTADPRSVENQSKKGKANESQ